MIENMNMSLNGYILEKQLNGEITEKSEKVSEDFFNQYQAKLAVIDNEGNPFGQVDDLLITNNPTNLLIKKDLGQTSIDLMSGAIKEVSQAGLNSIAISTDTMEEIEQVKDQIKKLLSENQQMQKIGFYYPDNK